MENKNIKSSKLTKKRTSKKNVNSTSKKGKKNVKPFMVNQRKKKRRALKIIMTFFLIGIIGAGIYLLLTLSMFNLSYVNLNETVNFSKEEIMQKAGLEFGKNTFIEIFKCNKKNVSTMPYVEKIELKIKLPNTIDIKVIERTEKYYGYDKDNNTFYKLSEDGYILENADINSKKSDQILLLGITFDDNVILGKKINDVDLSKIEVYKKIEYQFIKNKIYGNITKVSFENSLTTITINDKLNVIFPNDTDLEYKMSFLKGILSKIGQDCVGVIDMTKTNPTYSSF